MQYYPTCVTPNGGQMFPCNPFPVTQPCPCPQVIGEGNVTSVTLPDGSVQLYFVPAPPPAPAPAPAACCPCPQNYPNWNNPEAWFIRSIPNQFPAYQAVPNQQYQRVSSPSWSQNSTDYYGNKPPYQLKFHNDSWTSTTDLAYFSPPLRNWCVKQCASSQTEQPPCAPPEAPLRPNQLCPCACYKQKQNRKRHDVVSDGKSSCSSSMSVESAKEGKPTASSKVKKKKKAWPFRKIQISENPTIKCDRNLQPEPRKSDKAIATYSEKTVGCCAGNERATQTNCGPSTPIRRVDSFFRVNNCETEIWYPKTPQSRKSMECSECAELESRESSAEASGTSESDATSHSHY